MSCITPFIASLALALASSPPAHECSLPLVAPPGPRVFTNADLDRMAPCRYQTGAESEVGSGPPGKSAPAPRTRNSGSGAAPQAESIEADWRARWRSVDQRAQKLRREARELRQEAGQAPRDTKKPPTGRRSPSLLISRARSLEAEAKELEDEFQDRARREGALPGWLRPRTR